ncbi:amidohydrolase family protein [Halopseudomonas pelagia]|uniref:amidohydrolase family protein n=1 Tax=Halopseudomonas pelagia TaxID=553151 RepID=UPI0030DB3060|tara:strand:- start:50990 stop:52150 length:1161 start_codon:yes stop_codon:yes gene_type:complete
MKRSNVVISGLALTGAAVYATRSPGPAFSHIPTNGWNAAVQTNGPQEVSTHAIVDVNHEVTPAFMMTGLDQPWSVEAALEWMDKESIASSLLSVSPRLFSELSREQTAKAHRRCNEYLAELVATYQGRFGMLASLPVANAADGLAERAYAVDSLGADGVMLASSHAGTFLGESLFEPLFQELNRRRINVLIKPSRHPTSDELSISLPDQLVEQPCDITRAAINMIFKGSLERYPDVRWILSEGGGFLPFVAWRLSLANMMPGLTDKAPQGVLHYLRRFWVDTSRSYNPVALATLGELFDPAKALFGSGYPSGISAPDQLSRTLEKQWSSRLLKGIQYQHALSLFPRLAKEGESPIPVPQYRPQSDISKLQAKAFKPVQQLMQKLRE